jgi:SAM-dependent methyltransferase
LSFPGPKIGGLPRIPAPDVRSVTCEHPLAYLLGIEGLALLRGFTGEFDREFVEARLAEVRRLLDDDSLTEAVTSERLDSVPGYEIWAETYDNAACGTGRYTRILAGRGHRVIGVDSSPAMLAKASGGDFRLGSRAGPTEPGPWERWPWNLAALVSEAARAAAKGVPAMLFWQFRLPEI